MPWEVFEAATERALEVQRFHVSDDDLNLIGGEPTLHPLLWEMIARALYKGLQLHLTTNGKNAEVVKDLVRMARTGILGVSISEDKYHEALPGEVYHLFWGENEAERRHRVSPLVEIRQWSRGRDRRSLLSGADQHIAAAGRGKQIEGSEDLCCCPDWFVRPNGAVHKCGCADSPQIGVISESVWTWDLNQVCHRQAAKRWDGLDSFVVSRMRSGS